MTRSSKVYQLSELDLSSRLDILYSQDMFSLAITIAQSSPQSLFEIYKRYGDFLYSKSEYDSAMTQYCKTIGSLEPSYVIRKYLDAQRILNLSFYLQMLHSNNVATSDHTTLLINCFTKLANINQLNIFLEDDKTSFDVDVAIKVCRDAGYFSHASNLSKKFNRHEWFLKIQIEDLKDYKTAIEYVSKLNISDSLAFLKMYGYLLVQYNASEMISVLIQVCTTQQCNPDEFTKLFLNKHDDCISFLKQVLLKKNMIQSTSLFKIYNILLELYISSDDNVDFYRREALELMMDKEAVYNLDHVLILCKLNNFVKGTLYCYQKRGMYSEIINHHLLNNQFDAVLDICRQGNWIDVLTNFANLPELSLDSLTFLSKLLNELIDFDIDTSQVLNILSINKSINIGLLAPFITQRNDLIQSSIQQDLDLISKLKQETAQLETILNEYSNPIVFQNTRCCICERPLELPTINFLCKHSFHQRCIGADDHCSVCFQEHQAVRDIQVGIVNVDHEGFRQELEGKRDDERFKFIAEYFGRDVFKIKE